MFLVLTIGVGFASMLHGNLQKRNAESQIETIHRDVLALDNELKTLLDRISTSNVQLNSLKNYWDKKGIGLVVFHHNKPVDWTTNAIPFPLSFDDRHAPSDGIVQLKNNWYLCRTVSVEEQLLVAYALLRSSFDFENRYIENNWGPVFSASTNFGFTRSDLDSHELFLADGVSDVRLRESASSDSLKHSWNSLFWLAFLSLLILCMWHAANWISELSSKTIGNAALVLFALIGRGLLMWWQLPKGLYELELFAPTLHATSTLIPSLGDFILHLVFTWLVVVRFSSLKVAIENVWAQRLLGIVIPVLLLWPVHLLLEVLVFNSSFSLDLNDPFSLNIYSFFGLLTSFLIFLNYYLIARFLQSILKPKNSGFVVSAVLFIAAVVSVIILLGGGHLAIITAFSGGLILGFLLLLQNWMKDQSGIYLHTPNIFAFSLLACIILTGIETENEHQSRIGIARKVNQQEDPITEFLFENLADNLQSNRQLRAALTSAPINATSVLSIIHEKLDYDHWNRYSSVVDIYNEDGGLMISDREITGPNYFELQSEYDGARPTMSESLRYVGHLNQKGGYLARLEIKGIRSQKDLVLFIQLIPEKIDDILGFTDLFVDESVSAARELEGYSYALYSDGALEEQHGSFAYSLSGQKYAEFNDEHTFVTASGYSHLVARPIADRLIVVSRQARGFMGYLTTFSYLFLFYLFCAVLISLFSGKLVAGILERRSFRNRINLAMSSVLFVSLLLIGILTVFYVVREYNDRNEEMISEKSRSVLIEMEHKLRDRESFDEDDQAMLSALLVKFSKVFFTDINLYHLDGTLLATSRPRLYDEGLMAGVMNPSAYVEMRFDQKTNFIQEETIGNLNYLTAYVPFRNEKREVVAFMSLPYFARQYGLQQEVFSLLAALTNIYVFLILISVVLALVISNRITEPLRFIRESLKNLKLDQANRAIEWESNDEIGELVDEYNRTLNELVQSAELLAKSERESAWREMAKQVAHEIKNPLTPMKLSIQMLQRSKNDGAEDLHERIDKVTKTLIEQIDTLSNIATEFSSFAQMPKSVVEEVNLVEILRNVTELHKNSGAAIQLNLNNIETALVKADKEQLLRVFTNLIKNAIQAIDEATNGEISVSINPNQQYWNVSIRDNGTGIPEELKDKIFVPNFTTKSSGMGLGLAMVKNIIESVNGEISFTSESGNGTTFKVSLPSL